MERLRKRFEPSELGKLFTNGRKGLSQDLPQNPDQSGNIDLSRSSGGPPNVLTASNSHRPGYKVVPKCKGQPQILGLVGDPGLNRDSGSSARFADRIFWTYRDTQLCNPDGSVRMFPIISSTASWSDYNQKGSPELGPTRDKPLESNILRQYGKNPENHAFYYLTSNFGEEPAGNLGNGTRIALWPDSAPLVTQEPREGEITAYTWIKHWHIGQDLSKKIECPATVLYRVDYHPDQDSTLRHSLPKVSVVNSQFWDPGEIGFGVAGSVVRDGMAYLYGFENQETYLARCSSNKIEDKVAYEYWVEGQWSDRMPKIGQSGAGIRNACAGGQGTYYYNENWQCYVWIGGSQYPGAECYITTAPGPMGPWLQPIKFYTGPSGSHPLGSYSVQAHPALATNPHKNEMYLTYTKNDLSKNGNIAIYSTPLVYIEFL
ncbi:hypothetical protein SCUP234_07374 [Seiridium cupressi]